MQEGETVTLNDLKTLTRIPQHPPRIASCNVCGSALIDTHKHFEWHLRQVTDA